MLIHSAFAHEQIYPHMHPHAASNTPFDILLSLLWVGGIVLLTFLLVKVTRQMIQILSRRRED